MYPVCLRVKGVGVGGMRVVFFQRSCRVSGTIAGCWGMLAALGSAEPLAVIIPTDRDSEHHCSHHGSTAWQGQLWSYSWTACSSRARGQKLSVMVVTYSVHGGGFLSTA